MKKTRNVKGLENEFVMVVGNADTKRKAVFQVVQNKLNMSVLGLFNSTVPQEEYRLSQAGGNLMFCALQTMGELMIDSHASPFAKDVDSSDETIMRLARNGMLYGPNLVLDGSCGISLEYLGPFTEGDPGFELKEEVAEEEAYKKELLNRVRNMALLFESLNEKGPTH
jgi:hypothetical protein